MRLVSYKIVKLLEPDINGTHQILYESISKNEDCGGYGSGSIFRGSYKECLKKKKEIENELSKSKATSSLVFAKV